MAVALYNGGLYSDDPILDEWRRRLREESSRNDSGCWIWTQVRKSDGYGSTKFGRAWEQMAHRLSYRLFVGDIPDGLTIDHVWSRGCTSKACVNPDHLEAVTLRENILRGNGTAAKRARQTHCKRGHEFTEENTYRYPSNGRRACRVCLTEYSRRRWLGMR